ncbi:E3 ubiquitin-protein ligase TRIM38-like [Talpa occidentalis]|uniref:E3 ubiquitin-protein ligase TRIM38-like n=1 Tax=Talpa occidentalis TaxID=50954 RepID=UPI00188E4259|nr:E3 ubiquitin-protein ligase TRIM38-like [Talpa occidentalis]XP_037374920.1 E3 ubiquitin-protein ligase TRIM38-like [Talpa occidentalis]XP_037374921.1 E3 ubiquitin-protein ligase TRIM38-like [Talpa occidentalis]XP_037374922.1 E3 ubiquitin-protein ligase TRIM38-like [Talpa occidentalis]XP_037374923.1 E3 ubiquitin-protein ligase TRIM38-like [Talpa occidentalis]XP_037374924.1 E3 ubiquitin-protein ligase TRIM38-like [Talpa occidentalis]XP_054554387.1 E3 ubiquitin-protein ligase TRIM38-like [Tal
MTSATATKKMREEATCSICLELMVKPVSIDCGHSFCCRCIESILENPRVTSSLRRSQCPLCQAPFERKSLRSIKQLENLIQTIREIDSERLCEEHGERLHLFCEDDMRLICWRCERSPQHRGHSTALVEDAGPDYKGKLQKAVKILRILEAKCQDSKLTITAQISKWEETMELQRQKIQSDFKNLYNFLREEEKAFLWRLEKEKEQTLKSLQDDEGSLEKQSLEIKNCILEIENKCQLSAQDLLQDVKDTLNSCSGVMLKLPGAVAVEPYTVCNVSELYLNVKKMLKSYQVSVTLDPDTAHKDLVVSENRRQVTRGAPQMKPNTSERFSAFHCVLGYEGFTSGRHYFEVDVGEGSGCDLGVCLQNVPRGLLMTLKPDSGCWVIRMCKTNGYMALTSPPTSLPLSEKPRVVGVFLDCEAGLVSFYNMATGSHIFTFPKASFSETLRPFFWVHQPSPLFLPPPDE